MQPPLLDEQQLDPVSIHSTIEPNFLGYTAASWLRLKERDGPVFRKEADGRETYIICGREADLTAWKTPDNWHYGPPASGGEFFRDELGDSHVTQLDGPAHRRVRKKILPAFGVASVTRDLPAVIELLSAELAHYEAGEVDLHPALSRSIARALNVSQLKESTSDRLIDAMVSYEEAFIPAVSLTPDERTRWYARDTFRTDRAMAFEYFERVADERLSGRRRGDSLDLVMEKSVDDPLQREELTSVVYLLAVAGVGNIANILCAALWSLSSNQSSDQFWLSRLRAELEGFDPLSLQSGMGAYPVLKAVIQEVERCYLPAPVIPKMSAATQTFLGFDIPSGVDVLHLHGLAHFESDRYRDPLIFDPGRWLQDKTERANAFGGGAHLCLGMGVTRLYVPLLLGLLVARMNWESESPPMIVSQDESLPFAPSTTRYVCELSLR